MSRAVANSLVNRESDKDARILNGVTQLEPNKGWVAVLVVADPKECTDLEARGFELQKSGPVEKKPAPDNWAKPAAGPIARTGSLTKATAPKRGVTARVWAIADTVEGGDRKAIIDACVAEGINPATAATQYSKWKKAQQA